MYIVSASANLIETLRLIVQNDSGLQPMFTVSEAHNEVPEIFEAHALLAEELNARCCVQTRQWLVLVSKEWESHILDTIADIARICISQSSQHATARIMVVKREPCAGDFELLRDHLQAVRECWRVEWSNTFEKYNRLGESNARTEHLAKLERWAHPAQLDFQLVYMDDSNLVQSLRNFAMIPASHKFAIIDMSEEESSSCFTKPPALHWTNYPREADVQVSFKFSFPHGSVTDSLFRTWSTIVRESYAWEYTYEWTNGAFLRQQLIKVALVRGPANMVEITGRIDTDEANEEDDEEREDKSRRRDDVDESTYHWGKPLHRVWPYFAKAFECFIRTLDAIQTLPYTLNLVFIGHIFFDSPEGARQVCSRSLDAVQTFGAIQRAKAVRFKVQDDPDHVYAVRLAQAFPGFVPTRLADVCSEYIGQPPDIKGDSFFNVDVKFQLRSDSAESLNESPTETCISLTEMETDKKSNGPKSSRVNGDSSICSALLDRARQSSNCLLADRQLSAQRNRGRRVSFGAIQAIPPQDLCGISASASTLPLLMRLSGSIHRFSAASSNSKYGILEEQQSAGQTPRSETIENANTNANEASDHVQTSDVIHDYVDRMLQSAMDEVLIDK